jgi:Family of unknown function (DUF6282)
MCDEHLLYDAVLGERMAGRTLTIGQAHEFNSRTYFDEMLEDNPAFTAVCPGIEDEVLVSGSDHHVHACQDFVHRSQDKLEIAIEASKAEMRVSAFKDHWNLTAGAAYLVQRSIERMLLDGHLEHRVEVYGGLGLNPEAVRVALKYPKFECLWFSTFKSFGCARFAGLNPSEEEYIRP